MLLALDTGIYVLRRVWKLPCSHMSLLHTQTEGCLLKTKIQSEIEVYIPGLCGISSLAILQPTGMMKLIISISCLVEPVYVCIRPQNRPKLWWQRSSGKQVDTTTYHTQQQEILYMYATCAFCCYVIQMSFVMRKPAFCICENKDVDLLICAVTAQLISAFVFATWIVQSLFSFKPLNIFYSCTAWFVSDRVGNPKDQFSHNEAKIHCVCIPHLSLHVNTLAKQLILSHQLE